MVAHTLLSILRKLRQEDHEFKASLGDIARPYLKNKTKTLRKHKNIW
jgi:hypothetical protein